jgi:hypothetical protein
VSATSNLPSNESEQIIFSTGVLAFEQSKLGFDFSTALIAKSSDAAEKEAKTDNIRTMKNIRI